MRYRKILCGVALGVASVTALIFLIDAILGLPFGRDLTTDIMILLASGLLIWQGLETWKEL